MKASLSYVLPVHNAQASLSRQVDRLLEILPDMTSHFEVVIVDDGSTDHTWEVAHDLSSQYPQVVLAHHQTPQGESAAKVTGLRKASGKVVVFSDAEFKEDHRQ